MKDRTFSEISCPLCKKMFRAKDGKSRTVKQWEASLLVHLIVSPNHYLDAKEAKSVVDSHLKKKEPETPSPKQTTLS